MPLLLLLCMVTSCSEEEFTELSDQAENEDELAIEVTNEPGSVIEGEYIVRYNPKAETFKQIASTRSMEERMDMLTTISKDMLADHRLSDRNIINVFGDEEMQGVGLKNVSSELIPHLLKDERILDIIPNEVIAMSMSNPLDPSFKSILVPADDENNGDPDGEWEEPGAEDLNPSRNLERSYKFAWIVDSGIDTDHDDLNVNTHFSRSYVPNEYSTDDYFGHGTHVAGIIGGRGRRQWFSGIAQGITLVSIKVLDRDGKGTVLGLINGLQHIERYVLRGDVINISLTTSSYDIINHYVQRIANRGAYVTIAAGNYGTHVSNYSPANLDYPNVYVVGAMTRLYTKALFSNYSSQSNFVLAPGTWIFSTFKDNMYARISGTSMAAPYVAGVLLAEDGRLDLSKKIWTPSGWMPRVKY